MELKNSETYKNLARAYAGECMAKTRYEFVKYGAEQENYKAMAKVIGEIIVQEFNHARMLYTFIQSATDKTIDNIEFTASVPFREKWNLVDNLRLASEDEANEVLLYEEFAKVADKEGFHDVAGLFRNIIIAEKVHQGIFSQLHEQMQSGTLYKKSNDVVWKCGDCGYEEYGKVGFTDCPLCHAKQGAIEVKTTYPETVFADCCK